MPTSRARPVAAPAAVRATRPSSRAGTSGTITDFFKDKGVTLEPQKAAGFTALNIVLPMPRGWSVVPDPNVPDAFAVIADRLGGDGLYTSNAQLKVYKLVGDFDPKEAISHGYVDSQQLSDWQSTDASMADFGGFPSSIIEGTYRENDHDAEHLAPLRHRDLGRRPLPGVAVGDDRGQPGRRRRRLRPTRSSTASGSPPRRRRPPGRTTCCRTRCGTGGGPQRSPGGGSGLGSGLGCGRHRHGDRHRSRSRSRGASYPALTAASYCDRMFIAGVVCLCLAVLVAGSGVWTLTRPAGADLTTQVMRAVAPTQLAAGVMLAAGGLAALAAPSSIALMVLILCVIGAVGTVAAGSWQGARYAARREASSSGCAGSCTSCTRSCE